MKNYPNYITKSFQYRTWILIGMVAASWFGLAMIEEPVNGVLWMGFSLMTARLILMRRKFKKQVKAQQGMGANHDLS